MASNEAIVIEFLKGWEEDVIASMEKHLAPDCVWHNTGFPSCEGKDMCLQFGAAFLETFVTERVEYKAVAARDDAVLVERVDYLKKPSGEPGPTVDITGVFRVRDGQIYYWHDYLDPRPFLESFMTQAEA